MLLVSYVLVVNTCANVLNSTSPASKRRHTLVLNGLFIAGFPFMFLFLRFRFCGPRVCRSLCLPFSVFIAVVFAKRPFKLFKNGFLSRYIFAAAGEWCVRLKLEGFKVNDYSSSLSLRPRWHASDTSMPVMYLLRVHPSHDSLHHHGGTVA